MSKPDYSALGLAAVAGALGALGAQYIFSLLSESEWNNENGVNSAKRRRGSLVPDQLAKRQVRAITWDMDGTLIQTELIWFSLLHDALKEFGCEHQSFTYDIWFPHFGQSMEENVRLWFPGVEVKQLDKYCQDNYHRKLELLEVIPGAAEALKFANEVTDSKIYIVTNCPRSIINILLEAPKCAFLKEHLSNADGSLRILCPGDQGSIGNGPLLPKPTTSMIMEVSHLFNVSSHEILHIGDACFDVECINSAGGVSILLSHEHKQNEFQPFLRIGSLSELYQILQLFSFPAVDQF